MVEDNNELENSDTSEEDEIDIKDYLTGLRFPADRDAVVKQAKQNEAPDDVINILQEIPPKKYANQQELDEEIET
jgi:hypothetical protein